MIENNTDDFADIWITACEMSAGGKAPNNKVINAIFETLIDYDISHIKKALLQHGKICKFAPTPHDIIKILHDHSIYADPSLARCPGPEEIIALAKLADTPLGVLAKIQIGSYDLENQDSFYLRQRAQEVILKFDDYVKRCLAGEYTEHEIATMKKYCVDCFDPIATGLPKPGKEAGKKLLKLTQHVKALGGTSLKLVKRK